MVDDGREISQHEDAGEHGHDIWTVANIITVLRLVLIPIFFSTLISDRSDVLAFALFATAASTDWLDGQIARRTGTVTAIGKAIDPLVDRLLIASGVIGLYIAKRLPLWVLVLLVARDVYLLWGAWRLEHYRLRMPVTYMGKMTTAVLLSGFSLMILNWPTVVVGGRGVLVGLFFMYAGIVLSVSTAVQYTFKARAMVARAGRSDRAG
ncbi:MAG: CDP-alcohol phosphatidyltransferase family protein [Actinomycetota bacterium]|nr:CDP-alcohol phosphatidyltransferase family protein [Actinomycetota bacterium]